MPRTGARRLVINASVARAAGGKDATHPLSTYCRDFLEVVRRKHYRLVMSQEIREEWIKHSSFFAVTWLTAMQAAGRVDDVTPPAFDEIKRGIEACAAGPAQCAAMLKDLHLIRAALITDRTIISGDRQLRNLLAAACVQIKVLRNIIWIDANDLDLVAWVQGGAIRSRDRQLQALVRQIP